jgi:hypothetical protein
MDKKIFDATIARSNEWKEVIFNILQENDETAGCLSLREQLEEMLDVDTVCLSDVDMFKKLKREYGLHVSIQIPELKQLPEVVRLTFKMCEDMLKRLPTDMMQGVDESVPARHEPLFRQRGEQVLYRIHRTLNMTLIDVQVRTDEVQCEDLLYWSQDKLFIMTFAPELEEAEDYVLI